MQVLQFDSTAVGSGERILAAARLALLDAPQCPVVVTSAMAGMTDRLLGAHARASAGDYTYRADYFVVVDMYRAAAHAIAPDANWSTLDNRFEALALDLTIAYSERDGSLRMRDRIAAWAERLAILLFAEAITTLGGHCHVPDAPVIVTDGRFSAATPLTIPTRKLAQAAYAQARARDAILLISAGIGQTQRSTACHKVLTTLDSTAHAATLIVAALGADECLTNLDVVTVNDAPTAPEVYPLPRHDVVIALAAPISSSPEHRLVAPIRRKHVHSA